MLKHEEIEFLENRHPSRCFMPALRIKASTLHMWGKRKYIDLPKGGRGSSLYLSGEELIYIRCLTILSVTGSNPSEIWLRGLRESITFFVMGCVESYQEHIEMPTTYARYRCVEHSYLGQDMFIEGEWDLRERGMDVEGRHITEAHGHKAMPYAMILNLTEILKDLSQQVMAAY